MEKFFLLVITLAVLMQMLEAKSAEDKMNTAEIIKHNKYPVETHKVQTDDGYILTMFRIPHGRRGPRKQGPKGVFYLQHGLLGSSTNFVTNFPRRSLAFTLADYGYEVWLGNTRGNSYSTQHQFLDVDSEKFWDFSHDEMVKYDLPAMVDHVLETSKHQKLYYIGHSQGTLIAFAKMSEDEAFQQKIGGMFALAPVAQLGHVYEPIKLLAQFSYSMKGYIEQLHIGNPLSLIRDLKHILDMSINIRKKIHEVVCFIHPVFCQHQVNITQLILQVEDVLDVNASRTDLVFSEHPLFLSTIPDGTSVKNFFHFSQLMDSGAFQKYDYNWYGNLVWYWSFQPPTYNLTNIHVPVVLMSGGEDKVSVRRDVEWLSTQLPNVLHDIVIPEYDHVGFTWAKSAYEKVYKKIVKIKRQNMK